MDKSFLFFAHLFPRANIRKMTFLIDRVMTNGISICLSALHVRFIFAKIQLRWWSSHPSSKIDWSFHSIGENLKAMRFAAKSDTIDRSIPISAKGRAKLRSCVHWENLSCQSTFFQGYFRQGPKQTNKTTRPRKKNYFHWHSPANIRRQCRKKESSDYWPVRLNFLLLSSFSFIE